MTLKLIIKQQSDSVRYVHCHLLFVIFGALTAIDNEFNYTKGLYIKTFHGHNLRIFVIS